MPRELRDLLGMVLPHAQAEALQVALAVHRVLQETQLRDHLVHRETLPQVHVQADQQLLVDTLVAQADLVVLQLLVDTPEAQAVRLVHHQLVDTPAAQAVQHVHPQAGHTLVTDLSVRTLVDHPPVTDHSVQAVQQLVGTMVGTVLNVLTTVEHTQATDLSVVQTTVDRFQELRDQTDRMVQ